MTMQAVSAPRPTDLDSIVLEAFSRSLSRGDVANDVSFFDLGGTSLTAAILLTELEDRLKIEIPIATLLESPTSSGFARRLRIMLASSATS